MDLHVYIEAIQALAGRRRELENLVGMAEARFNQMDLEIARLQDELSHLAGENAADPHSREKSAVSALEHGAHQLTVVSGQVHAYLDAIRGAPAAVSAVALQEEDRLHHCSADLLAVRENIEDEVGGMLEAGETEVRQEAGDRLEAMESKIEETRDECVRRADEIIESVETIRGSAEELTGSLFAEGLPAAVKQKAEVLEESLTALKEAGLDQLSKLEGAIGGVEEKVHAITGLVENVKPVLDLARQIL